ncbi:hypothetical protein B0F90DRAFT_1232899 [Multifurca ochricompacta]|uniref:RING-type domain-containing protein n=1 Tax=Multifurca ochricompacta TaxID=376703 RepID=A0AAD4M750_9AGAM|nr:hypothetical protein B0F90DRAFT_1232899 [Multifurca ochricompacta]
MAQIPPTSTSSPVAILSQASSPSSPSKLTRRLPRTHSRTHLSTRGSLESIIEEPPSDGYEATHPPRAMSKPTLESTREQERSTMARPHGWNGKKGITMGRGMRDVCGICFESAVKPNKARCCGQLFCYQHLSDWLTGTGSDGRCPTCRVPLSLETDTISLHPPAKRKPSWSHRFVLTPRHASSGSSSSSSQEYDSDIGSSSSTSEGEGDHGLKRRRALSVQPKYDSVTDLMTDIVPLREFGSLLSLVGCALVIGTLLS